LYKFHVNEFQLPTDTASEESGAQNLLLTARHRVARVTIRIGYFERNFKNGESTVIFAFEAPWLP